MGFQVGEVQRRLARVARAVLDGRYDRTSGLRHRRRRRRWSGRTSHGARVRNGGATKTAAGTDGGGILSNGTPKVARFVFRPEPQNALITGDRLSRASP